MGHLFSNENLAFLVFSLLLSEVSLLFFRKPRFFGKKARIGGSGNLSVGPGQPCGEGRSRADALSSDPVVRCQQDRVDEGLLGVGLSLCEESFPGRGHATSQ